MAEYVLIFETGRMATMDNLIGLQRELEKHESFCLNIKGNPSIIDIISAEHVVILDIELAKQLCRNLAEYGGFGCRVAKLVTEYISEKTKTPEEEPTPKSPNQFAIMWEDALSEPFIAYADDKAEIEDIVKATLNDEGTHKIPFLIYKYLCSGNVKMSYSIKYPDN